jgi:predicted flavoprotein YhiN
VSAPEVYDAIVLGGGAAGLMYAVQADERGGVCSFWNMRSGSARKV